MNEHNFDSIFDDFFGGVVDGATGHANCLECGKANSADGGGHWNTYRNIWYCDNCWTEVQAAESREIANAKALRAKIESGKYNNADLDAAVDCGLARRIYDDPDSNRPTGIEWI